MRILAVALLFLALFHCIVSLTEQQKTYAEKLFKEMGFDKREAVSRKEFKDYYYTIISAGSGVQNENTQYFFKTMMDKLEANLPDVIEQSKFQEYLSVEKLMPAVQEAIAEIYGKEYVPQVMEDLKEYFVDNSENVTLSQSQDNTEKLDL